MMRQIHSCAVSVHAGHFSFVSPHSFIFSLYTWSPPDIEKAVDPFSWRPNFQTNNNGVWRRENRHKRRNRWSPNPSKTSLCIDVLCIPLVGFCFVLHALCPHHRQQQRIDNVFSAMLTILFFFQPTEIPPPYHEEILQPYTSHQFHHGWLLGVTNEEMEGYKQGCQLLALCGFLRISNCFIICLRT